MEHRLLTYDEARGSAPGEALALLRDWVTSYPMNGHADLGRAGSVCPFLKKSALLNMLRLCISATGPEDEELVFAAVRSGFDVMERLPAPPGKERLGTIIFGFPNCDSPEGLAMLDRVYKRHKYYTLFRFRMIAFFHANSETHGLWNPQFRPMRSPMPVLAIRYLIEQDAAFAAKHKLLTLPYLVRFGPVGAGRLAAHWRHKAGTTAPDSA